MTLVPRSLFSRLVLVLLGGLVAAQALSLAIHAHERGRLLAEASGVQSAQRIADIVNVLEPLGAGDRRRLAAVFDTPPLAIRLDARPLPSTGADASLRGAFFESMIRRFLGGDREVAVVVRDAARANETDPMFGSHPMHGGWMGGGPRFAVRGGLAFVAQVRLADGTLVTFDSRQPAETLSWPYRLVGSIVILLVAVIALSLVAVRWTTRPLAVLAEAAEDLGRNLNRPPLAESGPLEVRRAARAFNSMQARLSAYLRDRTRILAAMSHDLKTPITRLRLRAELLQDETMRAKFERDLTEMEVMVAGTLDFMRGLESDEPRQPLDVNALVQTLADDLRETGGAVHVQGTARSPYLGRPRALRRCLTNLVENAIKYGTRASIVVEDGDERLVVRVRDEGPGLPDQMLERVFEPFYRMEESRSRETGGAGLGLAIAREIARSHGGEVVLRNRADGGLEAVLTLPRSITAPPATAAG